MKYSLAPWRCKCGKRLLRRLRRRINNAPETGARKDRNVPAASGDAEGVERMEFMLTLRRRGISDQAVLRAMDDVPREYFVTADHQETAYGDHALPIACGQTIS